jgi:uncharacterized protein YndB with AHSA1/START domain
MTNPIETASRATKAKIVFERTYRASVRELWDMWTTKEGFESWWAPEGLRAEVRTMEARPGGRYVYDMIGDTPETIAGLEKMGLPRSQVVRGRFSEFRPHQSLALTQMMDFVPGVAPYETTMRVEFFPAGEYVRMVLTVNTTAHSEEWTRLSREGFESQLGKLDKRFGH